MRSSIFSQNFSEGFLLESVLGGELAFPAGNVAEPFVDTDDIADIAVAALTEDRHVGQLYEVTGPRLLTFADAADDIAAATGRDLRYVPITSEAFAAALLEDGLPPDFVTDLTDLFTQILDGRNASLTDGVQRALGREPRDFRDYARETAGIGHLGHRRRLDVTMIDGFLLVLTLATALGCGAGRRRAASRSRRS